jgi:type I site-specific restriction endonuclease
MQNLNLPEFNIPIKKENGKSYVFDEIRKKYIVLTPEEWVRQNFIVFLVREKKYPLTLMAVEKKVNVNGQPQRFDLLIYNRNGQPLLIAEFKAPKVKVSQAAFDQAVRYNMALKVKYIVISNGLQHFICHINYSANNYFYLKEIPEYVDVCRNNGVGFS